MKNKKVLIGIIICLILAIVSGIYILIKFKNAGVNDKTAEEISYDFFETMFPVFNTSDYDKISELYLPCQEESGCYTQLYNEIFSSVPLFLEGVLEIESSKGNKISGQIVYRDFDGSYNLLDEYDNGWEGFGNKKVANFELIKKNGKMYLNKFEIVANYNWRTIQLDKEFLEKYMNTMYTKKQVEKQHSLY